MNALFDFIPYYCPNCGKPIIGSFNKGKWNPLDDYNAYASHFCPACDLKYQRCKTDILLNAADETDGDMKRFAEMNT